MFNKLLGKVDGADSFLVLSLIIFGVFFIGVLVYLILMKKEHTDYLKKIPFNETEN
jgi:preprotein translocase subunit SecG